MRKNIFVIVLVSLTFQVAYAEVCPDKLIGIENIQIQQSLSGDGTRCYLGIHPRDAFETLIYRDYLLAQDGLLMVFNSLSPDQGPGSAGARDFFFLPKVFTGYDWFVSGDVLVITGFVGKTLKFSLKTAQMVEMSGSQIEVSEDVNPTNMGGVEIISSDELYVDAGFKLDDSPAFDKSRKSVVKNIRGATCTLKNTQVYNYTPDSVFLKTFDQLKKTVSSTCPGFDI